MRAVAIHMAGRQSEFHWRPDLGFLIQGFLIQGLRRKGNEGAVRLAPRGSMAKSKSAQNRSPDPSNGPSWPILHRGRISGGPRVMVCQTL